ARGGESDGLHQTGGRAVILEADGRRLVGAHDVELSGGGHGGGRSSEDTRLNTFHDKSRACQNAQTRPEPTVPSVPLPTLVSPCSTHLYKRRKQRDTCNSVRLVWLCI